MCMVSVIADNGVKHIETRWPGFFPDTTTVPPNVLSGTLMGGPSRAEFDALKREVESLKVLLLAAKKHDEATGQPDCAKDEKVAALIEKWREIL